MDDKSYKTWREFQQEQFRRCSTVQLSIEELARDLYYDEEVETEEVQELDFDY